VNGSGWGEVTNCAREFCEADWLGSTERGLWEICPGRKKSKLEDGRGSDGGDKDSDGGVKRGGGPSGRRVVLLRPQRNPGKEVGGRV